MKGKKGICLILCILFLSSLVPLGAAAVTGESVDGVWASVALTGGANKLIFTADSAVEQQILHPDEQTPEQYRLPEGVAYDAQTNTLSLTDFNAPTANLVLTMMGGDFKLSLSGSSSLASISSESKGRGGSITICGDGALELAGTDTAILVRAGGAADFVRIEPQVRLTALSGGSVIRVSESALADGAIVYDTSDPQVTVYDGRRALRDVTTADGRTVDVCALAGGAERFGVEATLISDEAGDRIAYNIYRLEGPEGGPYTAGELIEEKVEDVSAYEVVYTPHDWTLVESATGAAAGRVRFARFTITAQTLDEGGTLSVSQSSVARGGTVEVTAVPKEGYKLVALTVNGTQVAAENGSYIIGGITADQVVTASFAEAAPASVTVTAPAQTALIVPEDGAEAVNSEAFTAVVRDGAGDPIGASVRWSLMPEAEGVTIGADGRVTVTNAAKRAVGDERSFTVVASVEGTEISDPGAAFTLARSESRSAGLSLSRGGQTPGAEELIEIPAGEETVTLQYAAAVVDQYGEAREEEIIWSVDACPEGVSREDGTLTVTGGCADGAAMTLTAAATSDSAVSASVTLRFLAPQQPEEESETNPPSEEGGENAPPTESGNETTPPAESGNETTPPTESGNETTPPAESGNETTPPTEGGNETTPPTESGNETTPPTESGNETTPPTESGSETTTPTESGNETTPPAQSGNDDIPTISLGSPNNESSGAETVSGENAGEEGAEGGNGGEEQPDETPAPVDQPAAPEIVWPQVILANDPVYGITWAQLVSLRGGSATLNGKPLEGSFAIDREGAAYPDVSDSFHIIFTYAEIGEDETPVTKTATSEEHAVTLARKKLDPLSLRVTLSPDTMQYDYGAECRPAVALLDGIIDLKQDKDFTVSGYQNNVDIGTGLVTVEGLGNYCGAVRIEFRITAIPASALTASVTPCRPEDEGTKPGIVFRHLDGHNQEHQLLEGTDYDLSLQYDIPAKTGTATVAFKGHYTGTRILSFDLPNYLITDGAGSSWSKNSTSAMVFRANGALGKFTDLTVDGKTVPSSYYAASSGSTLVMLKADYLKGLADGKHIIGFAYKDGKALAIFSVLASPYQGVATGDGNNAALWIVLLIASLIAFGALAFLFVRSGGGKKKKKRSKH